MRSRCLLLKLLSLKRESSRNQAKRNISRYFFIKAWRLLVLSLSRHLSDGLLRGAGGGLLQFRVLGHKFKDQVCRVGDGDGVAHALHVGIRQLGGVDTHKLSIQIEQRTAAVAGVDGGVGLDIG